MKLWNVAPHDKNEASQIQNKYELPAILAMMLQIRNIKTQKEIEDFLFNESEISSPLEIKDMDKAVRRIKTALERCELICVYGDYDADGVTSTSLLFSYLDTLGANAMYYIPSRESEGYGMNKKAIDFLNEKGVKLIVTVDNGIAAVDEIAYANSLGIDTVVTDHHMPLETLPDACAVVDLHRKDCPSEFKNLSGVGVAFKLVMALEGEYCDTDMLLDNYADLLCIGTVGDIVELKSENRVFVKRGLKSIQNGERPGISALVQNSGLTGKKITAGNVSFTLVPRINAVGRLGLSEKSVSLLLTDSFEEADDIAGQLSEDNTERQQIEREILADIDLKIKSNPSVVQDRVLVIEGEGWHQGVIGIVASRIKEAYGKPCIIISVNGDEAKASGRSVEGFALCDAVFACADLLTHYGGHPMAVGLSLKSENIDLFRKRINQYAESVQNMPFDALKIDCKLNPAALNVDMVDSLAYLQPFGAGNPTPIFGLYNMTITNIFPLSNNKHIKLALSRAGTSITALLFFTSPDEFAFEPGDVVDLAVTLDKNEYNGNVSVSVIIKDIKSSAVNPREILEDLRTYEEFCLGNVTDKAKLSSILPDRNDFALVYRYIKSHGEYNLPCETLVHKLDNKLSFGKIKVILETMKELRLIEYSEGLKSCHISLNQVEGKVNLESADIIKRMRGVLI